MDSEERQERYGEARQKRIESLLADPNGYIQNLDYESLLRMLDGLAKLRNYCIECGVSKNIHARNLCKRCYQRLSKQRRRHPESWQGWPKI